MKPDVIVCWPKYADYPLWREFIRENRRRFNNLIICFTESFGASTDFHLFIRMAMLRDSVQFLNTPEVLPGQDWRDVATKHALLYSHAEWVWFTEQDFLPLPGFFEEVDKKVKDGCNVIGILEGERLHPASLFIKNTTLNRTKMDFGVEAGVGDHFHRITRDLDVIGEKPAIIDPSYYEHFNGLSNDLRLVLEGQEPNYKPAEFREYLKKTLNCGLYTAEPYFTQINRYLRDAEAPSSHPTLDVRK